MPGPTRCFLKSFLPIIPTKGIVFRKNGEVRAPLYSGYQVFGPVKYQTLGRSLAERPEGQALAGVWMDHQAPLVAPREGAQASSLWEPSNQADPWC